MIESEEDIATVKLIQRYNSRNTIMNDSVLSGIIRIIVDTADPDSIILFGSRATGTQQDDSDYDLCILKTGVSERRKLTMQLYQQLWEVEAPVDILVETPDSFNRYKTNPHLIYREIAQTGKVSCMKNREIVKDWMARAESNLYRTRAGRVSVRFN